MADNQFHRDASNRLTFEMFRVPITNYPKLCDSIADQFQLAPDGSLVTNGADICFRDYRSGHLLVGLEWDNWSGFIVTAKTPKSEPLVRDIGDWLVQTSSATDTAE